MRSPVFCIRRASESTSTRYCPQAAVAYGAAHGALTMSPPGDTSMVNYKEVEVAMNGKGARVFHNASDRFAPHDIRLASFSPGYRFRLLG